ncbi:MAG: antitoxin, partial [Burkholderiales bacterium]|nr:antitoxin [Burkholderiales bacterium]
MGSARKKMIESTRTGGSVPAESRTLSRVVTFLGGRKILRTRIETKLEAHDAIHKGLPSAALLAVLEHVRVLPNADLTAAIGVSERTIQRRANDPTLPLSPEQSGRTWRFAEVLAKATDVLGD